MKNKLPALFLAAASTAFAVGPVVVFQDDFSTDTLAADYSASGVDYNATPETVTIKRGWNGGANHLEIAEKFDLAAGGATELTVAFDYAFGASMYGSAFTVQYKDGSGTGWQVIDTINYTGSNANDDGLAANPHTITITEGATYKFTDGAAIRLKAADGNGNKGYTIDNLTVSVDQSPVSGKGTVILISGLGGWLLFGVCLASRGGTRRGRDNSGRK